VDFVSSIGNLGSNVSSRTGGSYTVASENLGDMAGLFAAAALMIYGLLPDAKKWVDLNRGAFPEYPLRPAALLLKTRPPNFSPAGIEMFAACADWFKSFLAHCAPLDASLREEVVNTLIDWAKATLPLPTGIRPWGPKRVKTFQHIPNWRPN
jgi:hypothetical protein